MRPWLWLLLMVKVLFLEERWVKLPFLHQGQSKNVNEKGESFVIFTVVNWIELLFPQLFFVFTVSPPRWNEAEPIRTQGPSHSWQRVPETMGVWSLCPWWTCFTERRCVFMHFWKERKKDEKRNKEKKKTILRHSGCCSLFDLDEKYVSLWGELWEKVGCGFSCCESSIFDIFHNLQQGLPSHTHLMTGFVSKLKTQFWPK